MLHAVACTMLLLLAQGSVPQPKPDFSGRWALVEPPEAGPKVASQMTVTQKKEGDTVVVTVRRTVGRAVQSDTYKLGMVGGAVRPDGTAIRIAAKWDGSTLVLENGTYPTSVGREGRSTQRAERWSLGATGQLLVEISDQLPGKEPVSSNLVYRKAK